MRSKKAMKNVLASFVYQIVSIVCGLITPRLILSNFGSTYNGVVSSATQFLSMISVLTLGITGSTRLALYKTLGNDDTLGTSRIMKATKIYMRKVGFCVLIYAAVLCVIYPFISHNELTHLESATLIAIVSIGTFARYFFGISNQTLLQADQASYINSIIQIFSTITNTIFVAILIALGGSIYIVKLGSSLVFLISPIILNAYVKKRYKLTHKCDPSNEGMAQRGSVAVHSIANLVHDNAPLVILTLFTDAKLISVYTVYYFVVGKIKQLLSIVTSGIEAAFGNMWVKKEYENLRKNFSGFEFVIYCFTAIVFACVAILILPFVAQYTKGITDIEYVRLDLAILITLAEAAYCIRQPYVILVYATGNYKSTRTGAVIEAIINIIIGVSLTPFIGINGVIIATLVANTFRTIQYIVFVSKNVLERSLVVAIKRFLWLILTCGIIIGIWTIISPAIYRSTFMVSEGWLSWILQAIFVFVIACIVTLITSLIFYKKDIRVLLGFAKNSLHK